MTVTGSFVVTCHSFNQQLTQKQEGREKCTFFCHSHNHVSRGGRSPPELFFSPLSPLDGAPHPLLSLLSTEPSHNSFSLKFSASLTLPLLQQQQPSLLPPLYYILHSPLNPPSLSAPSLAQSVSLQTLEPSLPAPPVAAVSRNRSLPAADRSMFRRESHLRICSQDEGSSMVLQN